MTKFHSDDYIRFLRSIRPDNRGEYSKLLQQFNVGEDCPVFDGSSVSSPVEVQWPRQSN